MNASTGQQTSARGAAWLAALSHGAPRLPGYPPSVQVADVETAGRAARPATMPATPAEAKSESPTVRTAGMAVSTKPAVSARPPTTTTRRNTVSWVVRRRAWKSSSPALRPFSPEEAGSAA